MASSGSRQTWPTRPELGRDRLDGGTCDQHTAGRAKKDGGDQALGRSCGGLSTKVHVDSASEHRVLKVILNGGQEGDAPIGEEVLDEVLDCEEVRAAGANRAYNSDAICA